MRLVIALLVNLWLLLLLPLRLLVRWRAAPRGAWLRVDIDDGVAEMSRPKPFWDRRPRPLGLDALRRVAKEAAADPRVAGLLLVVKRLNVGSAMAAALRRAIVEARQRGVRVVCYLPEGGGTRVTFVASAADQVFLGPRSSLSPLGFALEAVYLKDGLDALGIQPEVFARGRYKTAAEPLVRMNMSEPQREQLDAVLEVAHETLLEALASGRSVGRQQAEQWVNQGPWSARAAVEQRLADDVLYEDELAKTLDSNRDDGAPIVPAWPYLRRRTRRFRPLVRKRAIAVVELHGPIFSESTGVEARLRLDNVTDRLESARKDPRTAGVVLHVSSPGGSVIASDRLLHAMRRLARDKPVVACLADVAASGGYMAALGAHAIVAQPTTVTGSIGVVALRVVARDLLRKLGISVEVVKRGERADMHSPARPLAEPEKEALERELDDTYRAFVSDVASSRGLPLERCEELAGGRVWSGQAALTLGLVDQLGGLQEALDEVRRRIGPGGARLEPALLAPRRSVRALELLKLARGGTASGFLMEIMSLLLRDGQGLGAGGRLLAWCPLREFDLGAR